MMHFPLQRIRKHSFNSVLALVLSLFILLAAKPVQATIISCDVTSITNYAPAVATTTFGRDAPIGTSTPAYSTSLAFHCQGDPCCDRDIFVAFAASPSTLVSGYSDIYPTNVPGIGVRFTISNGAGTACRNLPATVSKASTAVTCHQLVAAASPGYN